MQMTSLLLTMLTPGTAPNCVVRRFTPGAKIELRIDGRLLTFLGHH